MPTRRTLTWPAATHRAAGHHDDNSAWNVALVSEALPLAIYHTVMHTINRGAYPFDDVMKLFPDDSRVLNHWKNVMTPFCRAMDGKPIFQTVDCGNWVTAADAYMIPAKCPQRRVIRKVLLENGRFAPSLVEPPSHLLAAFTHPNTVTLHLQ